MRSSRSSTTNTLRLPAVWACESATETIASVFEALRNYLDERDRRGWRDAWSSYARYVDSRLSCR